MRLSLACLCLMTAPLTLAAQDLGSPMDAKAFDARTRGKTITYSAEGQPYGIEEYRAGQKVVWAFAEGDCREGNWFQSGEQICFDYHDETPLQCWTFYDSPKGLIARFQGDAQSAPLVSLAESTIPLNCPGPDVGA